MQTEYSKCGLPCQKYMLVSILGDEMSVLLCSVSSYYFRISLKFEFYSCNLIFDNANSFKIKTHAHYTFIITLIMN